MKTLINKYMAWACMAAVAAVMVAGQPSLARDAYVDAYEVSVLSDLVGVEDLSAEATAQTKYCGSQASGCTWAEGGTPGKSGSPPGTCKSKSGCSDKGVGKGGKECKCCKSYKDSDGTTKDCPTETAVHNILSVF
ncbi:MAG: hypothetical protein KJZ54_12230 [Phycisphaerales bacterium]|nr:hypothetical protein [Phycisphaerales bacterium]